MTHHVSDSPTFTPQAEEKHTADKLTSAEPESFPHRSEEVDGALGSSTPPTGTQRTGQVDSSPPVEQGGPSKSATEAPPGSDNSSTPSTGKNLSLSLLITTTVPGHTCVQPRTAVTQTRHPLDPQ